MQVTTDVTHTCPLCHSLLELKQINLTSAVYICVDLKCPYPVDQQDCILVKRRLRDINKPLSVIKREFELTHNIKKEFTKPPDKSWPESSESSPSIVSETDFPMQEIDDLLNSFESINQKTDKSKHTTDCNDINLESIISEVSSDIHQNRPLKEENIHSLGDELNVVPMSETQYQDMDNFLMDLLK